MKNWREAEDLSRRTFVKRVAGFAGASIVVGCARGSLSSESGAVAPPGLAGWRDRMGLQLYTVRDQIEKDFEGTLAQVAAAGYKEVEPTSYAKRSPAQVRAAFDRAGLSAPSTHVALVRDGELERQLAGYQQMGHRFAAVRDGDGRGGSPPPQGVDRFKRQAELCNQVGAAGKPYGVKVLIHNHAGEFQPFEGGSKTPYDILFENADPDVVAFELDIGWATVAGQNVLALFAQHPRRFPLWHVKDMADLATVNAMKMQAERQRAAKIVPVGQGEINYRPIFEHAADAGLEHYFIEQDTAPQMGSLDAMRTSAQNLRRTLS